MSHYEVIFDEGVFANRDVFIAHSSYATPLCVQFLRQYEVVLEVRMAVDEYLNPGDTEPRLIAERCLAAYRMLQTISGEDWDALEPLMIEEIAVLNELCDINDEGGPDA